MTAKEIIESHGGIVRDSYGVISNCGGSTHWIYEFTYHTSPYSAHGTNNEGIILRWQVFYEGNPSLFQPDDFEVIEAITRDLNNRELNSEW